MTASPRVPIVNVMTVDVEDYFHVSAFEDLIPRSAWDRCESRVRPNTARLLDVFDEAGIRVTCFVLGWVAERDPGLVRQIASRGHEIACHSYAHRLIYQMTPDEFRRDIRRARAVLEDASGRPVIGFRAPSYSVTRASLWALDVLAEEGYEYDASIFPIHHDRYGIPSAPRHPHVRSTRTGRPLLEIPGSTVRCAGMNLPVAGGGYFRLLPYQWTSWGIRHLNGTEGRPAVFYMHPWEIDPDQPRMADAPWMRRLRHYHNLHRTEARLRRLLREFRFDTLSAVLRPAAAVAPHGLVVNA